MLAPPRFAQFCLEWALPAESKDVLLGDLEEEFHLKATTQSVHQAKAWYLRQAILTAMTYMKRTQGGMMMFVVSILVFLGLAIMAFVQGGSLGMYINGPSFIMVIPPAFLFAVTATSKRTVSQAFKLMLDDSLALPKSELLAAKRMFKTLGNTAIYTGLLGVIVGAVAMASNIEPEMFSKVIGPATAVCLLTLLYGMIIKIPCVLAEQKIAYKLDMLACEEG